MKRTADVVVIGAGIQGTSVAYQLARRGITDVALVEMDLIGSGSSGRSAAMLMLSMSRPETIRLSQESFKEYLTFDHEFGESAAYRPIGYLTVATAAVAPRLREELALQRTMQVPVEELDPLQIKELVPALTVADLALGAITRTDGVIDPHAVMQAYAHRAREMGVEIIERAEVTGIQVQNGRVTRVETTRGNVDTPIVVNAGGARAAEIGAWVGLALPITNYKRHIFVTSAFPEIPDDTPFVMDLEAEWYFRKEGAGVLMGMGREESISFEPQFEWEFQDQVIARALERAPILAEARIVRGWAGLRSLTPDDLPILGYAPGVEGFINCCGWGGHGVMHAPIGGILTAELIADGHASRMDLTPFRYERFAQ